MKPATLLGLAIVLASIAAAVAEVDRGCLRELRELGITPPPAQAKRMCDPKNKVKPMNSDGSAMAAAARRTGSKALALGSSAMPSANERRRPVLSPGFGLRTNQ